MKSLVDKLKLNNELTKDEWVRLIEGQTEELSEYVFEQALEVRTENYGNDIYIRGLIEISNYCRNDCYYCGIRRSAEVNRYRLSKEEILECCREGWGLGFKTFVLQGGEDMHYSNEVMADIIKSIKEEFPDCALTLSLGEKSYESYKLFKEAGADRYLLRHETADPGHYRKLHPEVMSLENRKECLYNLKALGYQVGAGFMVGAPYQTAENIADDMIFLRELEPEMVGIGPFIPCHGTPMENEKAGTLEQTVYLLGLIRLMLPKVLLPATTALGTIDPRGREKGMLAGANVVMPNLSPEAVKADYRLYDNKISTGSEAAKNKAELEERFRRIGFNIVEVRGDAL